jgi:putative heme-binding domain-containing protein
VNPDPVQTDDPGRLGAPANPRSHYSRRLRCLAAIGVVLVMAVALTRDYAAAPGWWQKPKKDTDTSLKSPAIIKQGEAIFTASCSSSYCHGAGGMGGGAPTLRGRNLASDRGGPDRGPDFEPDYLFRIIADGIPNTAMVGFKLDLTQDRIWSVVAFLLSPVKGAGPESKAEPPTLAGSGAAGPDAKAGRAQEPAIEAPRVATSAAEIEAGKVLFFDLAAAKSCHFCHTIQGMGTPVGPDLTGQAAKPAAQLLRAISSAHQVQDRRFATLKITLAEGDSIVGVKKDEDGETLRVYDVTVLPAVLRTLEKRDIANIEYSQRSVMPGDYASVYTARQLAAIIAFLRSSSPKAR